MLYPAGTLERRMGKEEAQQPSIGLKSNKQRHLLYCSSGLSQTPSDILTHSIDKMNDRVVCSFCLCPSLSAFYWFVRSVIHFTATVTTKLI